MDGCEKKNEKGYVADAPYVRARTLARSPWLRTRARGAGRPSDRTTRGVTKGYPRPELCVYYKYTHTCITNASTLLLRQKHASHGTEAAILRTGT